jgi:hypothetical protein
MNENENNETKNQVTTWHHATKTIIRDIFDIYSLNREILHVRLENEIERLLEKLWPAAVGDDEDNKNDEDNNRKLIKQGSSFDKLLLFKWLMAMENGAFKYKLDKQLPTKYLSGKFKFVCQVRKEIN